MHPIFTAHGRILLSNLSIYHEMKYWEVYHSKVWWKHSGEQLEELIINGWKEGSCGSFKLQEVKVWGCNKISHSCIRTIESSGSFDGVPDDFFLFNPSRVHSICSPESNNRPGPVPCFRNFQHDRRNYQGVPQWAVTEYMGLLFRLILNDVIETLVRKWNLKLEVLLHVRTS